MQIHKLKPRIPSNTKDFTVITRFWQNWSCTLAIKSLVIKGLKNSIKKPGNVQTCCLASVGKLGDVRGGGDTKYQTKANKYGKLTFMYPKGCSNPNRERIKKNNNTDRKNNLQAKGFTINAFSYFMSNQGCMRAELDRAQNLFLSEAIVFALKIGVPLWAYAC